MLSHRRNLIIELTLLFIALLVFSLPVQAQPSAQNEHSVHKAKVIEHWTPERIKAAKPRDLYLDKPAVTLVPT